MNPFSRFLAQTIPQHQFLNFVRQWDAVERVVVDTFREQGNLTENAKKWRKLRGALRRQYPTWMDRLKPFWRMALIEGKPALQDPFLFLLSYEDLIEFRQNWGAMQNLPVAREAINRLLIDLQSERG